MSLIPSDPPPAEDSDDLTDEEVASAVETTDEHHLAQLIVVELSPGHASVGKQDARFSLTKHELKRRNPNLYSKVTLGCPGEPNKTLLFRINWLQRGQEYEQRS